MIKNFVLATAITVALAGCQSVYQATGMSTPPPDPKNPDVWVMTKTGCEVPYIVVSPEPIYIYRRSGPVTITWHLRTSGYSFDMAAQTPPPASVNPGPPNEISCPRASGNSMTCIDQAKNPGSWKYSIKVTADDSGPCKGVNPPVLDPIISNE